MLGDFEWDMGLAAVQSVLYRLVRMFKGQKNRFDLMVLAHWIYMCRHLVHDY